MICFIVISHSGICLMYFMLCVLPFRDPLKYGDWGHGAFGCHLTGRRLFSTQLIKGRQKQVREERLNFSLCFSVPLSCPLVLCNHINVKWQLDVSVINRVHVTRTRQQFEQVACMWLSVPHHISVCHKNHWHPIQRMCNCFKGFDGKVSHVWIVITPCSKFVHVLKENNMVNISPLNEQPVVSACSQFFDGPVCWQAHSLS